MNLIIDVLRPKIEAFDPDAKINTISIEDDGSHGLVLWQRPGEYIVHRWFTHFTDGQPVPDGVRLYSGGYYGTLDEAAQDLRERAR